MDDVLHALTRNCFHNYQNDPLPSINDWNIAKAFYVEACKWIYCLLLFRENFSIQGVSGLIHGYHFTTEADHGFIGRKVALVAF